MSERVLRWDATYTHLIFFREWIKGIGYTGKIKIRIGDIEENFPRPVNNVSFHDGGITIFELTGTIFSGKDQKLNLRIYEYPNRVVNAEVHVIRGDQNEE